METKKPGKKQIKTKENKYANGRCEDNIKDKIKLN
jgi:hypothetical protein